MTFPNRKQKFNNDDDDDVRQERLRQARWGFNVAFGFAAASGITTLVGICLLSTGQISRGLYTSLAGVASTAAGGYCMKLARESNDRLDKYGKASDGGDDEDSGGG